METNKDIWTEGSIAQINPEHDGIFGGCLLKVKEVHHWGLAGYFDCPGVGQDDYRVEFENCKYVGECHWIWTTGYMIKRSAAYE